MASFTDEAFQLRLRLSLDRSSNFSDTAGRQASVAFPGGSSDNPAAADWQAQPARYPAASFTNIHAFSESGAHVIAGAGTVNISLREAGTLSLAYARTYTTARETRQGLSDDLRSNEFFVTYGKRISEGTALGGTLRTVDSMIKEQFFEPRASGVPLEAKVDGRFLEGAIGLFSKPGPRWFAGAVASFGWVDADAVVRNKAPLPAPPSGRLIAATTLDRFSDDIRSVGLRAGVGYAPASAYGIYLDAQYLMADSNLEGAAEIARLTAGLDLQVTESTVFRLGAGVDSEQESTLSTGLSYRGFGALAVDVAYQYNAQPEIRREFGRFDLLSASLSYRF